MAKHLVIVESPAKSKTLAKFLGKDFDIKSTIGHVIDLPKSKLGVDVKKNFEPQYVVMEGKEKVLAELKKAAKGMDTIYLAPDPDREGEAIAWHVANTLKEKKSKTKIVRVTFNEITKAAVIAAIESPREIDMNLVNAQQARRVLDRLVGYSVSPFLWKTVARNLSAGRVQSVALRLVVEREEEILKFVSEEYWKLDAKLLSGKKGEFVAHLLKIDGKSVVSPMDATDDKIVIRQKADIDALIKKLQKSTFTVGDIRETERTRKPLAPFITSTLQQESARRFGLSPKQTMGIAQALYEGVDIGQDGPTGLITYMRTDSTRLSDESVKSVREYISKTYGKEYLPAKPNLYASKKSAQDAHEAIRPTYTTLPPDKLKKHLTPQQLKLYTLIWNRFVSCQMPPAEFAVTTVDITAANALFRVTSQKVTFDGFLKVYDEAHEDDENGNGDEAQKLPNMKVGDELTLKELIPNQSFTKPPARYSEAMLVKRMEADGIGRPSTYASIISTLKDRKYVLLEQKKLSPTDLGTAVTKILIQNFPDLFTVSFTSDMEKELDQIEEGELQWEKVVKDMYTPLTKLLGELKGKESSIKADLTELSDVDCPKCGKKMIIKLGRNGKFLACSGYPECKSTKPMPDDEAKQKTDEKCEKCGSPMIIKSGRFGRFMACSNYPDCKNAKPLTINVPCPKACGGKVLERQSKAKRLFYGCSNYPTCDFVSWDKPVAKNCPSCTSTYMLQKFTKAKGEVLKCPVCKHEISQEQGDGVAEPEVVA